MHTGQIGSRTISSTKPVIVLFDGWEVLEFDSQDEAKSFLCFYHQNKMPTTRSQVRIYSFEAEEWIEASN